jgi:hypothetical protein
MEEKGGGEGSADHNCSIIVQFIDSVDIVVACVQSLLTPPPSVGRIGKIKRTLRFYPEGGGVSSCYTQANILVF